MFSNNYTVQKIIAVSSAVLMGATVPMIWIYSYDRGINPLEGYTEPMGLFTAPLAVVAVLLAVLGHRWTATAGMVGIGTGLMAIFRIWTGTTITMTDLSIGYGVYVMIAASGVLTFASWSWRQPNQIISESK
ncbi:MAG: hypothetical protein AAGN35_12145 [Bacteroidota bacterium]